MKPFIALLTSYFFAINFSHAQTYTYDHNHQNTGIQYQNNSAVNIQYDANGNRISYSVSGGGPLPVSLLSFNAQKSGEQVLLTWSTSTEINTDKFDVEFSKDANSFSSFVTVPAKGNSSTQSNYSTIHCCPIEGMNFYRLKMIDKDGSFKYSEIRKVLFEFVNVMKLQPNPTSKGKNLLISFRRSFNKDGVIKIYNAFGALIYSSILNKGHATKTVVTDPIAAGRYSVIVDVDGQLFKGDFIKQ